MNKKLMPFDKSKLDSIIKKYPTPFYIYDEKGIEENAYEFIKAFSWSKGFRQYFAVKALPNPSILKLLAEFGFGADCSSLAELMLAKKAGIKDDMIMFTSNNTPKDEFHYADKLNAIINLDDITHIDYLDKSISKFPKTISFRYNPGSLKKGNSIIGKPEEAKYGLTREQLKEAYVLAKKKGARKFGLHTMVASNELNVDYFVETARILFELVHEIKDELGIQIEFVNLGGGVGIPYKPEDKKIEWSDLGSKIEACYNSFFANEKKKPKLCFELGRAITGPYGYLVSTVIHKKDIYKKYVGLDSCMANLMRPALYGAYHYISVLADTDVDSRERLTYDVVGSLCENNDKFAIDRELPRVDIGDVVVIHDAGAHGSAMGFNYNGKLRSAELLLKKTGKVKKIRRAETVEDYFATLKF